MNKTIAGKKKHRTANIIFSMIFSRAKEEV
jgi:hypothetical protein